MALFHFKFLLADLRGEKGGNFMFGPGQHSARHTTASHLTFWTVNF